MIGRAKKGASTHDEEREMWCHLCGSQAHEGTVWAHATW